MTIFTLTVSQSHAVSPFRSCSSLLSPGFPPDYNNDGNHSIAITEKQCLDGNITGNCCKSQIRRPFPFTSAAVPFHKRRNYRPPVLQTACRLSTTMVRQIRALQPIASLPQPVPGILRAKTALVGRIPMRTSALGQLVLTHCRLSGTLPGVGSELRVPATC